MAGDRPDAHELPTPRSIARTGYRVHALSTTTGSAAASRLAIAGVRLRSAANECAALPLRFERQRHHGDPLKASLRVSPVTGPIRRRAGASRRRPR
jgi:hypothetical protein